MSRIPATVQSTNFLNSASSGQGPLLPIPDFCSSARGGHTGMVFLLQLLTKRDVANPTNSAKPESLLHRSRKASCW
jgi:hypothetical protein